MCSAKVVVVWLLLFLQLHSWSMSALTTARHNEHGRTVSEHDRTINEHGRTIDEHGRAVNEHGRTIQLSNLSDNIRHSSTQSTGPSSLITNAIVSQNLGIFWSADILNKVPPMKVASFDGFHNFFHNGRVARLTDGCGTMQNRLLQLEDNTRYCARYRINQDQIQGEIFTYYLARILNIPEVLPVALTFADPKSDNRWVLVEADIASAQWQPRSLVVLTPYVANLTLSYIPKELQTDQPSLSPYTLVNASVPATDLVQWSDLIILDYLTANVDRVVNNMFNLQWNSHMMSAPAHNLMRAGKNLVFVDNESGLLHSYRLLARYGSYHEKLLKSLCLFRKDTADSIKRLLRNGNVGSEMKKLYEREEPLSKYLPFLPRGNVGILTERLGNVLQQMESCAAVFGRPGSN